MSSVLQLTKSLLERPSLAMVPGVTLRTFAGESDIEIWLDLRRRAFARAKLGVRDWDAAEFRREFLDKSWWRPQAMWFAERQESTGERRPVGTVTLASRGDEFARPVVHWLVVLPRFRRQGIARLLMDTLEAAAWDAGFRQVWLETHAKWTEAVALYRSLGYELVDVGNE